MSDRKPRVHGLGGVFFKSEDPQQLSAWYAKHLGIGIEGWGGAQFFWNRIDGQDAPTGPEGHLIELWQPNPNEPSLLQAD